MAFTEFPNNIWTKTIDTGEVIQCGQFRPDANGELAHIRLRFVKVGTLGAGTQGKCRIHQVNDVNAVFAESSVVTFSSVETALGTTNSWISWIRFDFDRPNFSKNINYLVSFAFDTYTRNGDTFYCGITYDYRYPTYKLSGSFVDNPTGNLLSMQVFSYQEPPDL